MYLRIFAEDNAFGGFGFVPLGIGCGRLCWLGAPPCKPGLCLHFEKPRRIGRLKAVVPGAEPSISPDWGLCRYAVPPPLRGPILACILRYPSG
jgi:hypothetical protein